MSIPCNPHLHRRMALEAAPSIRAVASRRNAVGMLMALLHGLALTGYPLVAAIAVSRGAESNLPAVIFRGFYLALALFTLTYVVTRYRRYYIGPFLAITAAYWTIMGTRLLWDAYIAQVALYWPASQLVAYAFGITLLPMLAFFTQVDEDRLERVFWFALVMVLVACIASVLVSLFGVDTVRTGRLQNDRFNTISLGQLGVTLVTLGAHAFVFSPSRTRVLEIVAIVVGLTTAAMAAAKGPIVSLAVVMVVVAAFAVGQRSTARRVVPMIIFIVAVGWFGANQIQDKLGYMVLSRFEAMGQDYGSVQVREEISAGAWGQFADHPLLGSGLVEPQSGIYPHNSILESLMATGVLGGLLFIVISVWSLCSAYKIMSGRSKSGWIALLFVLYLVLSLFTGTVYAHYYLWYYAASCVAQAAALRRPRQQKSRSAAGIVG